MCETGFLRIRRVTRIDHVTNLLSENFRGVKSIIIDNIADKTPPRSRLRAKGRKGEYVTLGLWVEKERIAYSSQPTVDSTIRMLDACPL